MFVWYNYLLVVITLKKPYSFFHAIEKILVVDQWLILVKARKPVLEWNFIEKTLRYYNFGDSLITWIKLFYLSNRKRFPCLHSLIWTREGLGEFETVMQTRDEVENSPNPSSVYIRLCKHQKKVFYCFYKISFLRKKTHNSLLWHWLKDKFLPVAKSWPRLFKRWLALSTG